MSFKACYCYTSVMDDEPNYNLIELVGLLQQIDINTEEAKENEFILYDRDGNKIYL